MSDSTNMWKGIEPDWKSLAELRDLLVENKPALEMTQYIKATQPSQDSNWCTTSCCVAGYGILNKIGPYPEIFESFDKMMQSKSYPYFTSIGINYTEGLLGNRIGLRSEIYDCAFDWLFDGAHGNDVDGAIYRLNYFLEHKSPPAWFKPYKHTAICPHSMVSMNEILTKYPDICIRTSPNSQCIVVVSSNPCINSYPEGDMMLYHPQYHMSDEEDDDGVNLALALSDIQSSIVEGS